MSLSAEALDEAARALEKAEDAVLVCHVNPDADAIGSMLGLAGYLAARGKRVAASWPNDPAESPRWIEALPLRDLVVKPGDVPKRPSVLVTLDAADRNRLDGLVHLLETAGTVICIDHHVTNPGFGHINLVDPERSSTSEIVFTLIEQMGGEIGPDVAACLYAGIVSDTGRFQYQAAAPETLRIAARLREEQFDHARLAQALYEDNSLPYLRLLGTTLERAAFVPEADLVWTHLSRADLKEARVQIQETDDLIDVIRTAREADVAAVLKEQREGGYKVSLRSRGQTDVAAVAATFGGGGHRLAAGYTSKKPLEESITDLVRELTAAGSSAG